MNPIPGIYDIFNQEFIKYNNVWLFSDPHFGDTELEQAYPERPTAKELVKHINSKAGKRDLIIFLGDIGDLSYVQQLRADKWLVMGNHDQGASIYQHTYWYKNFDADNGWTEESATEAMSKLHPDCVYSSWQEYDVCHAPFVYWRVCADNKLFDKVFQGPIMLGEKLILSHEPVPLLTWARNIHGHVHSRKATDKYHFNICSDAYDYKLFNLNKEIREGFLSNITSLHRLTIDEATTRKEKKK